MGNKVSMATNIRLILASDKDAQLRCYTLGSTSTVARLLKITIAMPKCQAYQTEFLFAVDYAPATTRTRRGRGMLETMVLSIAKSRSKKNPLKKKDSINHKRAVFKMQSMK